MRVRSRRGRDSHLVSQVQLACPVEVQDCVKGSRMAVKEVLVLKDGIVGAESTDLLLAGGVQQHSSISRR